VLGQLANWRLIVVPRRIKILRGIPLDPELNLKELLLNLARADHDFIVIGSSALAIQGWKVNPADLDVLARPERVDAIAAALGVDASHASWVADGAARRLECETPEGPVDIYVEVSGALEYDEVERGAKTISLGDEQLSVKAGSLEHIRDMRAAVGRESLPEQATPQAVEVGAPRVIAIDGPAGAGKSTVTRGVAAEIGWTYLDTGAMYRCVTLAVLRAQVDTDDPIVIGAIADDVKIEVRDDHVLLEGEDVTTAIREPDVTNATPHIAAYREVRAAMVRRQRQFFSEGGYVAEGRDVTTVVAPDAPLKIFLTASVEERARRRSAETGEPLSRVSKAIQERDQLDSDREHSALRVAEDAVVIDSTGRSVHQIVAEIAQLARDRRLV
jgi:cytidylate kinase